jgi:hypothetical protein
MTTYAFVTQVCPACGNINEYQSLRSTNTFGSADLDLRPPPMKRDTLHTWVKRCSECDCCFQTGLEGNDLNLEIMDTEKYQRVGKDHTLPELAKDFIRLGMLLQRLEKKSSAWLHAAWVCDDAESKTQASRCRKKAYDLIAENYETGRHQHSADYIGNPGPGLLALDLLRRSQHFELAQQKIDKVKIAVGETTDPDKEVMQAVVRFQAEKIGTQDAHTYTIRDAVDYVLKEN